MRSNETTKCLCEHPMSYHWPDCEACFCWWFCPSENTLEEDFAEWQYDHRKELDVKVGELVDVEIDLEDSP